MSPQLPFHNLSLKTKTLFSVAFIAALFRLIYWSQAGDNPFIHIPTIDEQYYLSDGKELFGLGEGGEHQPLYMDPLYSLFLGAVSYLFGESLFIVRVIQILADAAAAAALVLIGSRLWNLKTGALAGLLYALYPVAAFYSITLLKTTLTTDFLIFFTLYLSYFIRAQRLWPYFALGLLIAVGTYLRGYLILLLPFTLPLLFLRGYKHTDSFKQALLTVAGALTIFLGVGIYSATTYGNFQILPSNSGITLYSANNPQTPPGSYGKPDFVTLNHPEKLLEQYRQEAESRTGREMSATEVSDYWRNRALAHWFSDITVIPNTVVSKLATLVSHNEIANNFNYRQAADFAPILAAEIPLFAIILALGVPGLALAWRSNRQVGLLLPTILTVIATALLFYSTSRFRFPLVPVLILGTAYLATYPWRKADRKRIVSVTVVTVLLFTLSLSIDGPKLPPSQGEINLALAYSKLGESAKALKLLESFEKGATESQSYHRAFAVVAFRAGRHEQAFKHSIAALESDPDDITSLHNAAVSALETARYREALQLFSKAQQQTGSSEYQFWLGKTLYMLGDYGAARPYLIRAAQLHPPMDLIGIEVRRLLDTMAE